MVIIAVSAGACRSIGVRGDRDSTTKITKDTKRESDRKTRTDDDGDPSGNPGVAGTSLIVHDDGDQLMVHSPTGGWRAPILEVLGEFLSILVVNRFRLRPPATHLPRVVIDLRDVGHVTSPTLGLLITLNKDVHSRKGTLVLCEVCERVHEVIKLCQLDKMLKIVKDRATALAMMR